MSNRFLRPATIVPAALPTILAIVVPLLVLVGGSRADAADPRGVAAATPVAATPVARKAKPKTAPVALPLVSVHKSPTCGCCGLWIEHMREAGFKVEVHESDDLQPIKQRLGVPHSHASCHTAQVGPYFVEGHVPADAVRRLLTQRPDARGIAVPGMPMGSPGMEVPSGRVQPYSVDLIGKDGRISEFARYGR
jgi:hypothetical protein